MVTHAHSISIFQPEYNSVNEHYIIGTNILNPYMLDRVMMTFANSLDADKMSHNTAFYQDPICLPSR